MDITVPVNILFSLSITLLVEVRGAIMSEKMTSLGHVCEDVEGQKLRIGSYRKFGYDKDHLLVPHSLLLLL